jgi:hypothetical protein
MNPRVLMARQLDSDVILKECLSNPESAFSSEFA